MIAAVALASTAFTLTDTVPHSEAPSVETLTLRSSHHVTITYSRRSATITLRPIRGQRAPWRGDVLEGAVYASGRWTTFKLDKTDEGYEAVARIPEFRSVEAFALLTEAGSSYTWIEQDPQARDEDDSDGDDKPEEPEPEDPPEDGGLCDGIVDPWTGECYSEILDPWGDEESGSQVVTFTI